ncbi:MULTISPECIES: DUF6114 domain-containing protein [unclassified Nocardiopsis]|uniref:DUF6114 domain-containing protein n=1 Tax=unclassified Nocardiopsis TaxID=2649073 RepID=UPI00135B446C|nr:MULTISPECIES: DUF6114 domain-containing protein [unclassified Nocardiopsis]
MASALTPLRAGWGRFRSWRRGRPFWGGILLVAAGIELLVAPAAQTLILPIDLIIYAGIAGVSGTLIALLLVTLGVLSWLQPAQHYFFGVVGLLLALVSFVTSNFGGFAVGMLLGIVGGSLVFAWAPVVRRRRRFRRAGAPEEAVPTGVGTASPAGERPEELTETRAGTGAVEPAAAQAETVTDPRGGTRPLLALTLPLVAALTLASAPAPTLGWPWDDWFSSPDEEQEQPADEPSPSPSGNPSADPAPGDRPTAPDADEESPGQDAGGDPEEGETGGEDEERTEGDGEEGDPEDCELRTGESALAESEEEFLEAVRACQAARDEDQLPAVAVEREYDCSQGSVRTSGLTADRLTMSGARYEGVVECPTLDGPRRYIRLSMSRADFAGAELWFEDAGTRMSLGLPTMTMDGRVQMHITRMHVRLLGIPLTFTPDFPPPLLLPYMIVTGVDVDNPLATTDLMNIPDLNGQYGGA